MPVEGRRALSIHEGRSAPSTADTLNNLRSVETDAGNYQEAQGYFERALHDPAAALAVTHDALARALWDAPAAAGQG